MKRILLLVILTFSMSYAFSQSYTTSAGIRFGTFQGVQIKHFLQDGQAIEGLVSTRWNGIIVSGLYEFQKPFKSSDTESLYWYMGGGAHVGYWGAGYYYADKDDVAGVLGLDFIAGLEYEIPEVPFTASLDWKPSINLVGEVGERRFWPLGGGLSFRYTF